MAFAPNQAPYAPLTSSDILREMYRRGYLQYGMQPQGQSLPQPSSLDRAVEAGKTGKDLYNLIDELYGVFGGAAATTATSSLTPAMSTMASAPVSTGFQSGAEMVGNGLFTPAPPAMTGPMSSLPTAASGFDLAGIGSAGNYYLPALGAIGTFDLLKNQRTGRRGYLQGAASGAAMGSYFGPWGALIGGGVGLGMAGANELFDTNKYKTEGNRLQALIDKGINIPEQLRGAMYLKSGRKKSELINPYLPKDFVGNTPQYGWVNNKFANSRNESDLTAKDIWGYSAFFDKFGNDWLGKFSEKQREDIANKALQRGAVREGKGSIDINWTPELDAEISGITGPVKIPKAPAPNPATPANLPIQTKPVTTTNQPQRKGILGRIR